MTMKVHVDIVSAEKAIFSGQAEIVFAPAVMGEVGILPRHSPMLAILKPGEVRVQTHAGDEEAFFISGGILEVQPHKVTVLADTALRAKDLDEAAAMEAKERAQKLLRDKQSEINYQQAHSELLEAVAQLQAIQRLRKKK